jgi:hypothetical protein
MDLEESESELRLVGGNAGAAEIVMTVGSTMKCRGAVQCDGLMVVLQGPWVVVRIGRY